MSDLRLRAATDAPRGRRLVLPDTVVVDRPDWFQLLTPSTRSTWLNEVTHSRVPADRADAVIDEVVAAYDAHRLPVKWCVGPWTGPADFGDRLARRSWRGWGVRGMAADSALDVAVPAGVTVREVDEHTLDVFLDLQVRGWSLDPSLASILRGLYLADLRSADPVARLFVAALDGAPVASTGFHPRTDHAYFVGAVVLPEARGRGVYRALIAARLAAVRALGLPFVVTQAREATSAPMLAHLGFDTLFRSSCFERDPR